MVADSRRDTGYATSPSGGRQSTLTAPSPDRWRLIDEVQAARSAAGHSPGRVGPKPVTGGSAGLVGNFMDLEGLAPGTGCLKGRSGPVRDIQMADEPALTTFESEDIEKRRDRYVTTESGGNRRSASRDRHREFSRISEELESLRRLVLTERGSLTQQGTVGPSRVSPRPSTLPAAAVDDSARRQAMLPTPQLDTYDAVSYTHLTLPTNREV